MTIKKKSRKQRQKDARSSSVHVQRVNEPRFRKHLLLLNPSQITPHSGRYCYPSPLSQGNNQTNCPNPSPSHTAAIGKQAQANLRKHIKRIMQQVLSI